MEGLAAYDSSSSEEEGERLPPPVLHHGRVGARGFVVRKADPEAGARRGMKRTFAHVDGQCPGVVFIPVGSTPGFADGCGALVEALSRRADAGGASSDEKDSDSEEDGAGPTWRCVEDGEAVTPAHLSLSRTFVVPYASMEPCAAALEAAVGAHRRFTVSFRQPHVFVNEEATRSFVGSVAEGDGLEKVMALVTTVDAVLSKFGCGKFYEHAVPHVSMCWAAGDHREALAEDKSPSVWSKLCFPAPWLQPPGGANMFKFDVAVSVVEARFGRRFYPIPLRPEL